MQRWADVLSNVGHLQRRDCPTAIGPQEGPHTQHDGGQAQRAQHVEIDQPGEVQPLGEGQPRGVAQRVAHGLGEGWDEARHRLGCDPRWVRAGVRGACHGKAGSPHLHIGGVEKKKQQENLLLCTTRGVSLHQQANTKHYLMMLFQQLL